MHHFCNGANIKLFASPLIFFDLLLLLALNTASGFIALRNSTYRVMQCSAKQQNKCKPD